MQPHVESFFDAQTSTFSHVVHAGPGTLWTDLEKAGLSDLGGGQILQAPKK